MFEGSRLQPGDVLDALRPTHVRHQLHVGGEGEPDKMDEPKAKSPKRGVGRPFIAKGHMTSAHVVP